MTARLKATREVTVAGKDIHTGTVFAVRTRDVGRLVGSGAAVRVNAEGQTARESKRARRADKNRTRAKR